MSEPNSAIKDFESRKASVMKGIKEGALKALVDGLVSKMASPVMEAISPKFQEKFPGGAHLLEPAVQAALEFVIIMGVAELLLFAAPTAANIIPGSSPSELETKSQLLAIWMRKYAGERVGERMVEAALAVFPMVMEHFSEVNVQDLSLLLAEQPAEIK